MPEAIIIYEALQVTYNNWLAKQPEEMKCIHARLRQYPEAYNDRRYRVYPAGGPSSPKEQ